MPGAALPVGDDLSRRRAVLDRAVLACRAFRHVGQHLLHGLAVWQRALGGGQHSFIDKIEYKTSFILGKEGARSEVLKQQTKFIHL